MLGLVRTCKQSEAARGTHGLERVDIGTGQDMQTKQGSEGNSPAGDGRHQDWAGCKQSKAARGTHRLERIDIGTGQDMQTKQGSKGNSPAGEGRHWV